MRAALRLGLLFSLLAAAWLALGAPFARGAALARGAARAAALPPGPPRPGSCLAGRAPHRRAAAVSRGGQRARTTGSALPAHPGVPCSFTGLPVESASDGISVHDITAHVKACVAAHFAARRSHQRDGVVHVVARDRATAILLNGDGPQLEQDLAALVGDAADVGLQARLLAMALGQSEAIPVMGGELALGRPPSVLVVRLPGSPMASVGVQVMG